MKFTTYFEPQLLKNTSVKDKINYLVRLTQILAFSAIITGIIGVLISNYSIQSLNKNSLEPLDHLRLIKESYEQNILVIAHNAAQGRVTNYVQAAKKLEKEKEKINNEWNAYKNGYLTAKEKQLMPVMLKSIC